MSAAISSSVRPSPGRADDEAAGRAGAMRLQNALQPLPLFIARDFARTPRWSTLGM